MATKKKPTTAKPKKAAAKKSTPAKKAKAVKKVATKKVVAKKKVAAKKAVVKKAAPKKKVAVKKAIVKKATAKKAVVKKVVAVKKVAAKKTVVEKVIAVAKPKVATVVKSIAPTVEKTKVVEVAQPVAKVRVESKPLSRNQQKKSSLKKRTSERDSLIEDTYTANPKVPKNTKPVDHKAFKLAKAIVKAIEEKKGDNIVCIDLRNIENRVCDYFIICDGNSTTQVDAIGGSVEFLVKKELGERPYRSEGYENKTWILIDYVNVIVHVFDKETRHFYNLESLWADGERITF